MVSNRENKNFTLVAIQPLKLNSCQEDTSDTHDKHKKEENKNQFWRDREKNAFL